MAYDWGTGFGGATSGAMTGASVGGPWGAGIGGVLGALAGFTGSNKPKKYDTLSPEQKRMIGQIEQMIGPEGQLGQGYQNALNLQQQYMDPSSEAVQQFIQPYLNEFNQQTIPGLAERFAGLGAMGGGLSSSGFGQSLSSAAGNLQSNLAQIKAALGQQAANSIMGQYGGLTNQFLNTPTFGYAKPEQSGYGGFMQSWAQGGMPGLKETSSGLQDYYNKYFGGMNGNVGHSGAFGITGLGR